MKKNWIVAGVLGLVAAMVYIASMADYMFPGESAQLMAIWQGLEVEEQVSYPVMSVFAKILGGGNLIAPICGIIAVVTFFGLMLMFFGWRLTDEENPKGNRGLTALIGAATAAVVFLLTPAVRSAATHIEPRLFDFLWAILALTFVLPAWRFAAAGRWLLPIGLGVMVGLGVCDSIVILALLPIYVVMLWKVAHKDGGSPLAPLFLFVLAVFVTLAVAMSVFGLTIRGMATNTMAEFRESVGNVGWMFVLFFAVLPFVLMLFSSRNAFDKAGFVPWVFHVTLSFVTVLAVATPLSPSALMEPYGVNPVMTSAFVAAVAGYLAAYWWNFRHHTVSLVVGAVLAFVLVVKCTWNLFAFDGDRGAFADRIAEKILQDLGDRRWFISDGVLDNHIARMAQKLGKQVHVISLAKDLDEDYLARLSDLIKAEKVGGSKNDVLRYSLSLGVLPFVQDWFAADSTVAKNVAIFGAPDLWYSAKITPVPEFCFFGADPSVEPDWSVWKEYDAILSAPKGWGSYHDRKVTNPVDRLRYSLRRHLGLVANDRGVYLQDQKNDDEAWKMYELVLNEIDRDNICAIFNEVEMVGKQHPLAVAKKRDLERMLKAAVDDKNRRYLLWRLGTYYGYIRNPDTFVRLGHAWARSGRPGDALSQVRRAIDFVPSDKRVILLKMMAALYASDNEQKRSRQIYNSILASNANDHDALIGMLRLELLEGNGKKALEYLERAAQNSGDGKQAKIELAMVAMMKNELPQARELLKKALDFDAGDMQTWSLMAAVMMQQIDATKDEKAKEKLAKELEDVVLPSMEKKSSDQFNYYLQATKGFMLLRKGESRRREARDAFVVAARARPDIASTHDMVLGLDISLDDKVNAEQHAKAVLRRNRAAPLANYVMGSLALGRDRYDEAETYLRKAAEGERPVALALNDLAEVLRRKKNFDEAEKFARETTKKSPGLYVAWETLGSILIDAGRDLDEAESCIRKACQLSKDANGKEADVRMLISLARVQIARNDMLHAKLTVGKVKARIGELSPFERHEFELFAKGVR